MAGHRAPPTRLHLWGRRVAVTVTAALLLPLVVVRTAFADDGSKLSQVPGALSWTNPKDSRGIGVWSYDMSLDRGGVTSPGKILWSHYIDMYWGMYRSIVVIAIWLIDWVMSFAWLPTLATPVLALSRSLSTVVDRFGLAPTFLTVAATVAVFWMAKGRWATGVFELFITLFIASLALGVLSDPVEKVAGAGGLIIDSRDVGLELAGALATNGKTSADSEQLRKQNTGMLVDTFIRMPAQVLNFGTVIDGGKCEKAYDKVLRGGPYGGGSEIRDAVGDCDKALGDVAANPGPGQAVSSLVITPSALFILLFAIILSGAVFLAALSALYQSLKAIVTLVTGLLPGIARGALWQTAADLTMALLTLVFSIVFLSAYLQVIQGVFSSGKPGSGVIATFFFVDILLVAGIIVYWRGRKTMRRAADRLAEALSSRPGPGSNHSKLPERSNWRQGAVRVGQTAVGVATWRRLTRNAADPVGSLQRRRPRTAPGRGHGPGPGPGGPGAAALAGPQPPGPAGQGPGGPPPPSGSGPGPSRPRAPRPSRVGAGSRPGRRVAGVRARGALKVGAHVALAAATGGGSAATSSAMAASGAGRAAATAQTARRAVVAARLAAARGKAAASERAAGPAAAFRRLAEGPPRNRRRGG